jgi:hypothetical protein
VPRYLFETDGRDDDRFDAAVRLVTQRFPELAVDLRATSADGDDPHAWWLVQAPSVAHVLRWAEASQLSVEQVQRITVGATHRPTTSATDDHIHNPKERVR